MKELHFLRCHPCVFAIGDEYEILIHTKEKGIVSIHIGNDIYYEDNSGVLSSEKCYAKIRLPQKCLDEAKEYSVSFRACPDRRAYFTQLGEIEFVNYSFRPLTKTDDIHIYHTADVHYHFEMAKRVCSYFQEELDILVVNGDIGEVETEENYFEVAEFVGDVTKGGIPVIFTRGNHDARGKLAEKYPDYFPAEGKKTYFKANLGPLTFLILDLGEDKLDSNIEYGGVNAFEPYRRRELEFLKSLTPTGKPTIAVGHIPPACNTLHFDDERFKIEDAIYRLFNVEMERLNVSLMLSGHVHRAFVLPKGSEISPRPHSYPVVFGSACFQETDLWGAAITLSANTAKVCFTNTKAEVEECHLIDLNTGLLL